MAAHGGGPSPPSFLGSEGPHTEASSGPTAAPEGPQEEAGPPSVPEDPVPPLLLSLVPPSLVRWLREEASLGGPSTPGLPGGAPSSEDSLTGYSEDSQAAVAAAAAPMLPSRGSEEAVSSGIDPLYPLEQVVAAQLSRFGGEAWEALRPPRADAEALGGPPSLGGVPSLGGLDNDADSGPAGEEEGEERGFSLGESRALLQALLPLAAHKVSAAALSDQQEPQQQQKSGAISLIPQPSGASSDALQQGLDAPQKPEAPLTGGLLLKSLYGAPSGLTSGPGRSSELQRRRLRRRRQTLLRQLLKSRALLLQLAQQIEQETPPAAATAAAEGGEVADPQQQQQQQQRASLRQRIRAELRRAAITVYDLSCCSNSSETGGAPSMGAPSFSEARGAVRDEAGRASTQQVPQAAAAAAQQQQWQQEEASSVSYGQVEGLHPCGPELLLPLAALPLGGDAILGEEAEPGDPEGGPSPAPPPSPISRLPGGPSEDDTGPPEPRQGAPEEDGPLPVDDDLRRAPWALHAVSFDGRRSAFLVTLSQTGAPQDKAAEEAPASSSSGEGPPGPPPLHPSSSRGPPSRRTKVFYCLCRSRANTAAVAAKYAELRQRASLTAEEAAAAETLSDEADTEQDEPESAAAAAAAAAVGGMSCRSSRRSSSSSTTGTIRLLQEVGDSLQLLQLQRQRLALQQQGSQLLAAASRGCWYSADTVVWGAPYPFSEPPWRYGLGPLPPGVRLRSQGPSDAQEGPTPGAWASSAAASAAAAMKGAPSKLLRGAPKGGGAAVAGAGAHLDNPSASRTGGEDDDSASAAGGAGKKGTTSCSSSTEGSSSSSSSGGGGPAAGDTAGAASPTEELLPFPGDPPDAKPWPRPPVSRAPYTCICVEAPIGAGGGAPPGGPHSSQPDKSAADNPSLDAESAEGSWGDGPGDNAGEETAAAAAAAAAAGEGFAAHGGAGSCVKAGETGGLSARGGTPSGGFSWALRVTERQKGDSWQLRMVCLF
ncbi:hypothetical protein Emag_005962 [Eimeria magna]